MLFQGRKIKKGERGGEKGRKEGEKGKKTVLIIQIIVFQF